MKLELDEQKRFELQDHRLWLRADKEEKMDFQIEHV